MGSNADPTFHRDVEQRFMDHVQLLVEGEELRLHVSHGFLGRRTARRSIDTLSPRIVKRDQAIELKRLMSEMNRPDRSLQQRMPTGQSMDVDLARTRFGIFRNTIGYMRVVALAPMRELIAGQVPPAASRAEVEQAIARLPPISRGLPVTMVIFSTGGFDANARDLAHHADGRTVILVEPNEAGGFNVVGPSQTADINDLFNPEGVEQMRQRIRSAIESARTELSASGIAADRLAAATQLPAQSVEAELKSYARENPGLVAKKLDGRMVLFSDGSAVHTAGLAGATMPMIDRIKSLFARRGETEKKIAFLAERRTALSQQADRAYEEIGTLEKKDVDLREEFKSAGAELSKRRITSQLLQLRKEIERRQQLIGVLNQQVNVVSTHLHNLQLVQQGQTAKLPDSEEMAGDAAAAEEMLATLQESSEMAESVSGVAAGGMSAEEQALYDELIQESGAKKETAPPANAAGGSETSPAKRAAQTPPSPIRQQQKSEPEAG